MRNHCTGKFVAMQQELSIQMNHLKSEKSTRSNTKWIAAAAAATTEPIANSNSNSNRSVRPNQSWFFYILRGICCTHTTLLSASHIGDEEIVFISAHLWFNRVVLRVYKHKRRCMYVHGTRRYKKRNRRRELKLKLKLK